jgi:inorganic pyrophosphatase
MEVEVVVEIPQGSRNKYELGHVSGRIRLDRLLFTSTPQGTLTCGISPTYRGISLRRPATFSTFTKSWSRAKTRMSVADRIVPPPSW